jgi:hypothetical protein
MQHNFYQPPIADRLLQQENIVVCSEIHCLRDDAILGMRLIAGRIPPEVFPAEPGDGFPENVICCHAP